MGDVDRAGGRSGALDRRRFGGACAALLSSALMRGARADEPPAPDAHEVPPPPSHTFRALRFEHSAMLDKTAVAIAAIPNDLPPGARLPMVVLLPGGVHGKQRPERGCWGWWSDFRLGDVETALRRGRLTRADFHELVPQSVVDAFDRDLAAQPYRGAVLVTPWVLSRQTDPRPHAAMVTPFLRTLVERARAELPVLAERASTGLGGVSAGGLWAIHCGSQLSELFSTLVALQPFTEDLERLLRKSVAARAAPQRLRVVTALGDRLRSSNVHLVKSLRADGVAVELAEYGGAHDLLFPGGPGGIDALVTFDRALVRTPSSSVAPVASSSSSSATASASASASASPASSAVARVEVAPAVRPRSRAGWIAGGVGAAIVAGVAARAALRPRPAPGRRP